MVKSKKHLSFLLGYPYARLLAICSEINDYYYEKIEIKRDKQGIIKVDKNGIPLTRVLLPSKGILKTLQSKIKNRILSEILFPFHIQGGVKKRDNITNARLHIGKNYHFCTDIKDFFPTISSNIVYKMFLENQFSSDIARILTKLTTFRFQVPQGAPTSTHLANLVFMMVDKKIIEYCSGKSITYTRFVDDLTFSSEKDFKKYTYRILKIIEDHGYKISNKKTFYKIGPTEITGVITKNNVLDLSDSFVQKVKSAKKDSDGKKYNSLINYYVRVNNKGRLIDFDN